MRYQHPLPPRLVQQALSLVEFANGGAQCHAKLRDGTVVCGLLISNATAIIAMRGHRQLPFSVDDVVDLYQVEADRNPVERGEWEYWDDWNSGRP